MARKKKEEAQKTRQQLIEAAIRLFATRGVASTTLTDIADAAQPDCACGADYCQRAFL